MSARRVVVERETRETKIRLELDLDGQGHVQVGTGLGFFDHMVTALLSHARFDAALTAEGDLHIDEHHTVEDVGIVLGSALDEALRERAGVARFGDAHAPLDEALARAVVDFSGRPCAVVDLALVHPKQGEVLSENLTHFFQSLAMAARMALHVDVIRGQNDHHKAEAAFKAVALALHRATRPTAGGVPSTKGVL